MERLTKWNDKTEGAELISLDEEEWKDFMGSLDVPICTELSLAVDKLADYEDAEEQGLLLRLPAAIGQTVYTNFSMQGWYCRRSNRPYEAEVVYIGLNNSEESGGGYINISFKGKAGCMMSFTFKEIGISVFLTKEEAEQALAKMKEV